MKRYNTIEDFIPFAICNDYFSVSGKGIMTNEPNAKTNVLKFICADENKITFSKYRSKKRFCIGKINYNQTVTVLSKAEFQQLPTYE